jgi:hypothetical protein
LSLAWLLAPALLIAVSACDRGDVASGICKSDRDCADGLRCVPATGVCVGFVTPLDAAVPDLAPTD